MKKLSEKSNSQYKFRSKIPTSTDRKQEDEALVGNEQTFKTILDNDGDGIVLADVENKKFLAVKNMLSQMLGYSSKEIIKLGVKDIHPKESLPYVFNQFEKQAKGEISIARDIPITRKDGSIFYADINAVQTKLQGKKYLLGIFRDITERKRAEQILKDSESR